MSLCGATLHKKENSPSTYILRITIHAIVTLNVIVIRWNHVYCRRQVSKSQFRRALDQAGLTAPALGAPASDLLTQKEVEVLSRRYEVKGQGGTGEDVDVNYWKLCEQIEKVCIDEVNT